MFCHIFISYGFIEFAKTPDFKAYNQSGHNQSNSNRYSKSL